MPDRLYPRDPLTPKERAEYEDDLIAFCDRELNLLGDIRGLTILYAGGSSLLWLEGLSQRIGESGSVTALDTDAKKIEATREALPDADLAAPIRLVTGDVFEPPFAPDVFDLVYSAGLFHELDVRERSAEDALATLVRLVRPGGRVATSDFVVGPAPAVQIEDEAWGRELARALSGAVTHDIGSPVRLVALHEDVFTDVRWRVSPPYTIRHLDKLVLDEGEPEDLERLPAATASKLRARREALLERIRREGYTRPATLYVEGYVSSSRRPKPEA
jgi:SAM-dependent methyltransferase